MRNVKFRAKHVTDNMWVYGYYTILPVLTIPFVETNNCLGSYIFNHYIIVEDKGVSITKYEVEPETLSQYIGLKDIGEVEIYEGDILNDDGHEYVVRWSEDNACFILDGQGVTLDFSGQDSEWYEIIGNIYE